jgi:hypothetical protein
MTDTAALRANGIAWRDRVIADARSEQGRRVARVHQAPNELVIEAVRLIATYLASGQFEVSRRDTIGALCGPGQARRVARYLAERGHVELMADRDLIRICGVSR